MPGKSPSPVRVAVIAGAFAMLASAVTPAQAAVPAAKERVAKQRTVKKRPAPVPSPAQRQGGGGASRRLSLEWMIGAEMRP